MPNQNVFSNSPEYAELSTPSDLAQISQSIRGGDVQLDNLFGGKRKRGSKKGSKKGSRKGSRKTRRGSKKSSKKAHKTSKKAHKGSKKSSKRRSRRGSRKSSKGKKAKKASTPKKSSKRRSRRGSRKSKKSSSKPKKSSKKSSKRRSRRGLNPGMQAFADLRKHIEEAMPELRGPKSATLAGFYKRKASEQNPNLSSIEASKEAKKLFDKDSKDDRMKHLNKAIADKKKSKE